MSRCACCASVNARDVDADCGVVRCAALARLLAASLDPQSRRPAALSRLSGLSEGNARDHGGDAMTHFHRCDRCGRDTAECSAVFRLVYDGERACDRELRNEPFVCAACVEQYGLDDLPLARRRVTPVDLAVALAKLTAARRRAM